MYLTDTLESPYTDPPQPPLMADRLTTEQRRARRVKDEVPVFVCMGNPPYFREEGEEKTRGKWVRTGDPNVPGEAPILEDFLRPARDADAGVHLKNIYNLYVYFWRWTLWKMFENPRTAGCGIVSFITAASYLRGPGFVGMRQKLREAFDELWIVDLEGDNLGARKTENVFDIQTPVCIAIGVRYSREKRYLLAITRYSRITGTQAEKYRLPTTPTTPNKNSGSNEPLWVSQAAARLAGLPLTPPKPRALCGRGVVRGRSSGGGCAGG
jgi:predicted helicase